MKLPTELAALFSVTVPLRVVIPAPVLPSPNNAALRLFPPPAVLPLAPALLITKLLATVLLPAIQKPTPLLALTVTVPVPNAVALKIVV